MNVDVNDRVKKGQVLVELDTAKLRDQIRVRAPRWPRPNAKVAQTVATVKEAQATSAASRRWRALSGGKVPSQTELDTARAALDRARADEASARASVTDAQAALSTDEINLAKASIRAPSRRRGADAQGRPGQRGGGVAAGGDAVHASPKT